MTKSKQSEIPVANERLIEEVASEFGMSKAQVKDITSVQGEFTARIMRGGGLEGVMWPLFGKIKVKVQKVWSLTAKHSRAEIKKNTTRPK